MTMAFHNVQVYGLLPCFCAHSVDYGSQKFNTQGSYQHTKNSLAKTLINYARPSSVEFSMVVKCVQGKMDIAETVLEMAFCYFRRSSVLFQYHICSL